LSMQKLYVYIYKLPLSLLLSLVTCRRHLFPVLLSYAASHASVLTRRRMSSLRRRHARELSDDVARVLYVKAPNFFMGAATARLPLIRRRRRLCLLILSSTVFWTQHNCCCIGVGRNGLVWVPVSLEARQRLARPGTEKPVWARPYTLVTTSLCITKSPLASGRE
jgi:hypothetical protein